jgi:hypothetical protein
MIGTSCHKMISTAPAQRIQILDESLLAMPGGGLLTSGARGTYL